MEPGDNINIVYMRMAVRVPIIELEAHSKCSIGRSPCLSGLSIRLFCGDRHDAAFVVYHATTTECVNVRSFLKCAKTWQMTNNCQPHNGGATIFCSPSPQKKCKNLVFEISNANLKKTTFRICRLILILDFRIPSQRIIEFLLLRFFQFNGVSVVDL